MAKSVGNITREMNKSLTRREASRLAQNERRKAERRLARELSSQLGRKVDRKEALSVYESQATKTGEMKALARTIRGLQAKTKEGTKQKIGYAVDIKREAESIASYTQIKYGTETLAKKGDVTLQRRNKMFERQINQSTMKNGLSTLSREDTKAFYASTLDIWNGLSNADNRNAQIMMKFGVSDLSQVYKLLTEKELKKEDFGFSDEELFQNWLKELNERVQLEERRKIVQEELASIKGTQRTGGTTDDDEYNQPDEKTAETSPEYINRIISRIATALNNV